MPARKTPRPLRTAFATRARPDMRTYPAGNFGNKPSLDFDWDAALYRHALTMRELGYELSKEQRKRIDDHETAALSDS